MAMDFFEAQEAAKSRTFSFLLGFLLIITATVAFFHAVIAFFLVQEGYMSADKLWHLPYFLMGFLGLGSFLSLIAIFQIAEFTKGGGIAIAQNLGGRRILYNTSDDQERQFLNVVEEMAIAAQMRLPALFVLDKEPTINAFAAGIDTNEAAIAITFGALSRLSRDELQAVIAHEFGHITNGDMALNVRLMGALHAIFLLSTWAKILLENARHLRGKKGGGMMGVAFFLLVGGSVGHFFGQMLRAMISRQREYLADAASVQFTRNPDGLIRALQKIRKYSGTIAHPKADEAAHLFFAAGIKSLFATHPSLASRILRLLG